MTTRPAYEQDLGAGLILRPVQDEADAQRFIDLSALVTNEGLIVERLLHHHPDTRYDDYMLVVDEQTGLAASSTCLIPWVCDFDGLPLNVAMLEMVVTHPDYRRRGLVRIQIERFQRAVVERGFDLSIIQGIPYYYRQYGYAYAVDHTPLTVLPAWRVPPQPADPYRLRPAGPDDIATLTQLYQKAMALNQISVRRSSEYWHYLLHYMAYPVQLVEDSRDGHAVGYMTVFRQGDALRVQENGITEYEVALAGLSWLKSEGAQEIQVAGSPTNSLVRPVRSLGGGSLPADQWLWHIPNVAGLLTKLAPILERRLANSDYTGLTTQLSLNLYRQAYTLKFETGHLMVEPLGFVDASMGADGGDLCIPPEAFIRLLLGYRRLDELIDTWPDIRIKPASRYLLDILFPSLDAHILMPY